MTHDAPPPGNLRWFDPSQQGILACWKEVWLHRELLWMWVLRDLQVRYSQTVIGIAWVIIQPLAHVGIFSLFFSSLGEVPADEGVPYPIVILTGMIIWQWFLQSVNYSTHVLVNQRVLITKVYFPRIMLPLAIVLGAAIDFVILWMLLVVVSLLMGLGFQVNWLLCLLLAFPIGLFSFAVSTWTSALNSLYRDVGHAVPFALQMGMFVSPVLYQSEVLFKKSTLLRPYMAIFYLNPLAGLIDVFRALWLNRPFPSASLLMLSFLVGFLVLMSGLWFFPKAERDIVDRV